MKRQSAWAKNCGCLGPHLLVGICVLLVGADAIRDARERSGLHLAASLAALVVVGAVLARWLAGRSHDQRTQIGAHASLDAQHVLQAEHSAELVLRVGQDGAHLYASPACRRLLGYEPEELMALSTAETVHPDDLPALVKGWEAVRSGPVVQTFRMRRKDGTYMWAEASAQLLPTPAGAHPQCLVVARDIDARVAAQQELRESEERYRLLAETASDMIFHLDLDFVHRYVSPATFDILGYRPEELIGSTPDDMTLHPDDSELFLSTLRALAAGKDRERQTGRVRHREGHWIWVEIDHRLRRDDKGRPSGIVGVLRDITERRAAEDREAAAVARLQATNDVLLRAEAMTQIGHWRYDAHSGEITASDEIYRIHGWAPTRRPTLKSVLAAYHPQDRARVWPLLRRATARAEPFTFDVRVVGANGAVRCVVVHGEPERDGADAVRAMVGTLQDVTERTLLEHELRDAQEAKMIGRLAAGVAHDFNNLLQAVMGSLELIQDAIAPRSPLQKLIAIALTSTERGAHLSHHLLSYAARQVLVPEHLDLPDLLDSVKQLLETMFGSHVAVECRPDPDLPAIEVDPAHLRTALLNIGINGGEAMPSGGTLTIEAWCEDGPRPTVVIAVADTGSGMEEAILEQAFDPFYTTKGAKKTGLGLSMVKGFARQSGGSVRIVSEAGLGTRVELRLPAAPALLRTARPVAADLPRAARRRPDAVLLAGDA